MKDFFYLFLCVAVLYALNLYHLYLFSEPEELEDTEEFYQEDYYWEGFH